MNKTAAPKPSFIDNPAITARKNNYKQVAVDSAKVLESWRASLFSYEWILSDGRIKDSNELPAREQPRRAAVEAALKTGTPLEKPVLGIGLLENIEIGIGRATFLTLTAHGVRVIPVHIPLSNEKEFLKFLAQE